MTAAQREAPGSRLTTATAPPGVVANHAASLRLEAGTRIWIRLNSKSSQPDGSFTFTGSLHLPLSQGGATLLARGTAVTGRGTLIQGHASLLITEFVVQGTHYLLKAATTAKSAETPGAGKAVKFEGDQILEVFLASPSVYEKASDGTGQPQPQN